MNFPKKRRILVTRPDPQGKSLVTLLEQAGFEAISWPTMVTQTTLPTWRDDFLNTLATDDIFIFVSPTAVHMTYLALAETWQHLTQHRCIAVGKGTADALLSKKMQQVDYPLEQANSEAVLALPILQHVKGQQYWLFRGDGGRELLPDTLRQRGAMLSIISTYHRTLSTLPIDPLLAEWHQGFDLVVNTSNVGLDYLQQLLGTEHLYLLQQTPVTVFSKSMLRYAESAGISALHWLPSVQNDDIVDWIMRHL